MALRWPAGRHAGAPCNYEHDHQISGHSNTSMVHNQAHQRFGEYG